MRRIVLTIEYDGTGYSGWQVQPNGIAVQQRLQEALKQLTGEDISVAASGRTDAGVHALGQVAHFDTDSAIPVANFVTGLNRFLPADIAVKSASEADGGFHARFSARSKTYIYKVYISRTPSPLFARTHYVIPHELFLKSMQTAALEIVGTHDFKSFCASGSPAENTVRTVYSLNIEQRGNEFFFTVTGSGFLYNMVRIMVALLVEVGQGKRSESDIRDILNGCDRKLAPVCAPACGLYLTKVEY